MILFLFEKHLALAIFFGTWSIVFSVSYFDTVFAQKIQTRLLFSSWWCVRNEVRSDMFVGLIEIELEIFALASGCLSFSDNKLSLR